MTLISGVQVPVDRIADVCRRYEVKELAIFGSAVRGSIRPDSDIDILVEFAPGETPSLFDLGGMQVELSQMLGRDVDLKTPGFLSPRILQHVLEFADVRYAACP